MGLKRLAMKYRWTPELDSEVRWAWGGNKRHLTTALDKLTRKHGWPRHAFKQRAQQLGLRVEVRRIWTEREREFVAEYAGTRSATWIARHLGRQVGSVEAQIEALGLSRRVTTGYTITDLSIVFGEHHAKVSGWVRKGLFGRPVMNGNEVRVRDREVVRFLREHHSLYNLARVAQEWFKAMLFAPLAQMGDRD